MMNDEPPFIVRRRWVNPATPETEERISLLGAAIEVARHLAMREDTQSTMVTDDRGMRWAEFAMLWSVPEEYR